MSAEQSGQERPHPPDAAPNDPESQSGTAGGPTNECWGKVWSWLGEWREPAATTIVVLLLAGGALWAWVGGPLLAVTKSDAPAKAIPTSACTGNTKGAHPLKVSDASGATASLNIFIGRGGGSVQRQSAPLAIQNGTLSPGTPLCTASSDLVRTDGQTLPANQVASWAVVDNDGTHVTVFVKVAPRYEYVSGFGGYSGTVFLADPRAVGANVPVNVHVEFYNIRTPVVWALVAAFGGFVWAWFIHRKSAGSADPQLFWASLTLRVAVLLVAAVPVINAQVLTNLDWEGSLSQYITLASLAGAAAIAATPTLRAVISRATS